MIVIVTVLLLVAGATIGLILAFRQNNSGSAARSPVPTGAGHAAAPTGATDAKAAVTGYLQAITNQDDPGLERSVCSGGYKALEVGYTMIYLQEAPTLASVSTPQSGTATAVLKIQLDDGEGASYTATLQQQSSGSWCVGAARATPQAAGGASNSGFIGPGAIARPAVMDADVRYGEPR